LTTIHKVAVVIPAILAGTGFRLLRTYGRTVGVNNDTPTIADADGANTPIFDRNIKQEACLTVVHDCISPEVPSLSNPLNARKVLMALSTSLVVR
jgi:hypothetical protein